MLGTRPLLCSERLPASPVFSAVTTRASVPRPITWSVLPSSAAICLICVPFRRIEHNVSVHSPEIISSTQQPGLQSWLNR